MLRNGVIPDGIVVLPDDRSNLVYKGFAAFFGVGSMEEPGVLDDEIRRRYRGVDVRVTPVSAADELPEYVSNCVANLLPGFYYVFSSRQKKL